MFNLHAPAERDSDGQLPSFAWPGGYPLFYLTRHADVLCAGCATKEVDGLEGEEDLAIASFDINWEDPHLYCDECGNRIESAYADDDETPETVKK